MAAKKQLELFYEDDYRELVTNLPRLGALRCSELSRLKGYLQTLFPPGKIKIFSMLQRAWELRIYIQRVQLDCDNALLTECAPTPAEWKI